MVHDNTFLITQCFLSRVLYSGDNILSFNASYNDTLNIFYDLYVYVSYIPLMCEAEVSIVIIFVDGCILGYILTSQRHLGGQYGHRKRTGMF